MNRTSNARFQLTALGILLISIGLFLRSAFEFFPSTAANIGNSRTEVSFFLPQGWDFFPRNPRESMIRLLALRDNSWKSVMVGPKSKWNLGFGWVKSPRAQMVELKGLLKEAGNGQWIECEAGKIPSQCLESSRPVLKLRNLFPHATLCGQVAVVSQAMPPWVSAKAGMKSEMSSKILYLDVEC